VCFDLFVTLKISIWLLPNLHVAVHLLLDPLSLPSKFRTTMSSMLSCPICSSSFDTIHKFKHHKKNCRETGSIKLDNGQIVTLHADENGNFQCACTHPACPSMWSKLESLKKHLKRGGHAWKGPPYAEVQVRIACHHAEFDLRSHSLPQLIKPKPDVGIRSSMSYPKPGLANSTVMSTVLNDVENAHHTPLHPPIATFKWPSCKYGGGRTTRSSTGMS